MAVSDSPKSPADTKHSVDTKDLEFAHVNTVVSTGDGNPVKPARTLEAPELIRDLSPEERAEVEKQLVRSIDLHLLPMVILMYIMNYLDRNNIASARLAGLQDDLSLTSVQYEVSDELYLFLN